MSLGCPGCAARMEIPCNAIAFDFSINDCHVNASHGQRLLRSQSRSTAVVSAQTQSVIVINHDKDVLNKHFVLKVSSSLARNGNKLLLSIVTSTTRDF